MEYKYPEVDLGEIFVEAAKTTMAQGSNSTHPRFSNIFTPSLDAH